MRRWKGQIKQVIGGVSKTEDFKIDSKLLKKVQKPFCRLEKVTYITNKFIFPEIRQFLITIMCIVYQIKFPLIVKRWVNSYDKR